MAGTFQTLRYEIILYNILYWYRSSICCRCFSLWQWNFPTPSIRSLCGLQPRYPENSECPRSRMESFFEANIFSSLPCVFPCRIWHRHCNRRLPVSSSFYYFCMNLFLPIALCLHYFNIYPELCGWTHSSDFPALWFSNTSLLFYSSRIVQYSSGR